MSETTELRGFLESAQERFENYRASVAAVLDERAAGELSRALDAILPDLVFYEGQACAAGMGLARIDAGAEPAEVAQVLAHGLVEQQAARRSGDYLAGFAFVLSLANRDASA